MVDNVAPEGAEEGESYYDGSRSQYLMRKHAI